MLRVQHLDKVILKKAWIQVTSAIPVIMAYYNQYCVLRNIIDNLVFTCYKSRSLCFLCRYVDKPINLRIVIK